MNIKELEIKNNTLSIKLYLEEIAELVGKLNEQRKQINNNDYISQQGKEKQINELIAEYKKKAESKINFIVSDIERIKEYCAENDAAFTPENNSINNAINVIEQFKKEIPNDVKESYINYFKGDNKSLKILSAAFNKYNINSDISKYIIDADEKYNKYIEDANNLIFDDTSIIIPLLSIYHGIIDTAEALGVSFTDEQKQSKIEFYIDDLKNDIAKKAMGII